MSPYCYWVMIGELIRRNKPLLDREIENKELVKRFGVHG